MIFVVLGTGKTGSLVAEVARERGHDVRVLRSKENSHAAALTPEFLSDVDVALDFTNPQAAVPNIMACLKAGKPMVVGTTGWYEHLPEIRSLAESSKAGFVYSTNFSVGVNLFLEISRVAAAAMKHGYFGQIFERHHAQKKDAPSGTALTIQQSVKDTSGAELEITSFREGDVIGMHEVIFESPHDDIYLCHDAKSRRGFAEGAVRAAEWIAVRKGFYNFRDVWPNV